MPRWMVDLTGIELVLLACDAGSEASCDVVTEKVGPDPLDTVATEELEWRRELPEVEGGIASAFIDLLAGRIAVLQDTEPESGRAPYHPVHWHHAMSSDAAEATRSSVASSRLWIHGPAATGPSLAPGPTGHEPPHHDQGRTGWAVRSTEQLADRFTDL